MVSLTIISWMSGYCIADEASVRADLASTESTSYLQQAGTRIELIETGKNDPSDAMVFKKYINNLPLHGARV